MVCLSAEWLYTVKRLARRIDRLFLDFNVVEPITVSGVSFSELIQKNSKTQVFQALAEVQNLQLFDRRTSQAVRIR